MHHGERQEKKPSFSSLSRNGGRSRLEHLWSLRRRAECLDLVNEEHLLTVPISRGADALKKPQRSYAANQPPKRAEDHAVMQMS